MAPTNLDRLFHVPITNKGQFFSDDFFRNSRAEFQNTVQEIMKQHGQHPQYVKGSFNDNDFFNNDIFNSYNSLRERDQCDKNRASFITTEDNIKKVVIDVKDFMSGQLSVKTVGSTELVVEGVQEKKDGIYNNKFKRHFTLPSFKGEDVTSILSIDGILTISVPVQQDQCPMKVPIQISGSLHTVDVGENQMNISEKTTHSNTNSTISEKTSGSNVPEKSEKPVESNVDDFKSTNITSPNIKVDQITQPKNLTNFPTHFLTNNNFPLFSRGSFLRDSYFDDIREEFNTAMRKSMGMLNDSFSDDLLTSYRNTWKRNPNLQQTHYAVATKDDEHNFKLVLDAYNFKDGNVMVKIINERELVIEGDLINKDTNSSSSHSFKRLFTLPQSADYKAITSTMSSDGILTIDVPKTVKENGNYQNVNGRDIITDEQIEQQNSSGEHINKNLISDKLKQSTQFNNCSQKTQLNNCSKKTQLNKCPKEVNHEIGNAESNDTNKSKLNIPLEKLKPFSVPPIINIPHNYFENFLPINLSTDDFWNRNFEKDHEQFRCSVRGILSNWGLSSSVNDFNSYRTLRNQNLCEENQASAVSEDDNNKKIMLDVHDFIKGDLKVKAMNEDELIVEGYIEKKDGGSSTNNSFKRHFYLPGLIDHTTITSTLSTDGVLTINVPKKKTIDKKEYIIPTKSISTNYDKVWSKNCSSDGIAHNTSASSTTSVNQNNKDYIAPEHCKSNGTEHKQAPATPPIANISTNSDLEIKTKCNNNIKMTSSGENSMRIPIKLNINNSSNYANIKLQESAHKQSENKDNVIKKEEKHLHEHVSSKLLNKTTNSSSYPNSNEIYSGKFLPIVMKGNFFTDSFFEDSRSSFNTAVKEILSKWGTNLGMSDTFASYQDLRTKHLKEENQAASVTEEENNHKIVIDVQTFKEGEVKVRAISSNEFIVEGCAEKQTDSTKSSHSFKRSFCLPNVIDIDNVTSALSSDGILTITAPKTKKNLIHEINDQGPIQNLRHTTMNKGATGSSWQEEQQQSTEGDGYSSKSFCKTFHSEYQSPSSKLM